MAYGWSSTSSTSSHNIWIILHLESGKLGLTVTVNNSRGTEDWLVLVVYYWNNGSQKVCIMIWCTAHSLDLMEKGL